MRVTYKDLLEKKNNNCKAVLVTAYDFSIASIVDNCKVDVVLVGDSASMVMLGNPSTLDISVDEMIVFGKAVRRGLKRAYMLMDMPFLSYQPSKRDAIKNCGRVLKETHCDGVKMEGGIVMIDRIKAVIDSGIPVCGHIGMKPQSYKIYGGYPVLGEDSNEAANIIKDGVALEKAGANMIIVENTVDGITEYLSKNLKIPVYSIGSGCDSDGQIVVINDILGMYKKFVPRFAKKYADISKSIEIAVNRYADDVVKKKFPEKSKIPHSGKKDIKNILEKLKS